MYKIITQQKSYDYYVSLLYIHKKKRLQINRNHLAVLSVHLRPYLLHNSFFFFFLSLSIPRCMCVIIVGCAGERTTARALTKPSV